MSLDGHRALERLYLRRSQLLEEAFGVLAGLLAGEPVVLLKGVDYRRRLPTPEHRPMQDIDLLVRFERIDSVVERLVRGGLERCFPGEAARLASYHERVLRLGEVTVEVHHSFVQRVRHRIDYTALFTRAVPIEQGPEGMARLADANTLATHALSLAIDEFSVPLIRYLDLWLLLDSAGADALEAAAERARSWRTARPLYGALRQLFRVFPEAGRPDRLALAGLLRATTRSFLDRWVLPDLEQHGKGKNMSRAVELWRKSWLLDNAWRRVRFGAYHLWASITGRWPVRRG